MSNSYSDHGWFSRYCLVDYLGLAQYVTIAKACALASKAGESAPRLRFMAYALHSAATNIGFGRSRMFKNAIKHSPAVISHLQMKH
jgi:hypothetical protein